MPRYHPILVAAIVAAALPLNSGTASAFSISTFGGKEVKWAISDVGYHVDSDGWSGIGNGKDKQAIDASFDDWENVSCSFLQFHKVGDTTVSSVIPTGSEPNGKNELIWKEGYWPFSSYTLGVTSPLYNFGGTISEADIAFNGTISWNTNGSTWNSMDVKSVAIHEIGHFFGVGHNLSFNENDPPTMAPYVDPYGKTASLHSDDKAAICFLYPESPYTCSSNSQCPYVIEHDAQGEEFYAMHYKCSGGSCEPDTGPTIPGQGELGANCTGDSECQAPLFCMQTYEGNWCTQWCNTDVQDCPDGFACYGIEGSDDGICVNTAGTMTFGEYCFFETDCKSPYFCLEWWSGPFCSKDCTDVDGGTGCPTGYTCYASAYAPLGQGACFLGEVTLKDNGKSCSLSSECKSGMCFPTPGGSSKACRDKCEPIDPFCSGAYKCIALPGDMTGKKGGCIPFSVLPESSAGSPCQASWECESNYCYYDSELGQSACRQTCDVGADNCPADLKCLDVGGGQGACLPAPAPQPEGAWCLHHHECITGYCVELPGTGKKYCRNACTPGSGCQIGTECVFYDDPTVGACMPVGKAVGDVCSSSTECTTQVCWADSGLPTCMLPCVNAVCPDGYSCFALSPYGPVCLEAAGDYDVGAACTKGTQCKTGLCIDGMCRAECNVLSPQCAAGEGCVPLNNGSDGACVIPGGKLEGAACANDFECATLLCVQVNDGGQVCRTPCAYPGGACPTGLQCTELADMETIGACTEPVVEPDENPNDVTGEPASTVENEVQTRGGTGAFCSASESPSATDAALLAGLICLLFVLGSCTRRRFE